MISDSVQPHVAVVIPTLDEERTISSCLTAVGDQPGVSVVVVDGGSADATCEVVARDFPEAVLIDSPPGRGVQLDRGARTVDADVDLVLFVHADCRLPDGWCPAVRRAMSDDRAALGCFRLRTEPAPGGAAGSMARLWWRLFDLRSLGLGRPYGDQALFLRRDTLERIGGVPPIPLMEDVVLVDRCLRLGRLARVPLEVRTTGRRFATHPARTFFCLLTFPSLFRLGVDPERLARWYRTTR